MSRRIVAPVVGPFSADFTVRPYRPATVADDGTAVIAAQPRTIVLRNVNVTRMLRGKAVTTAQGSVSIPRADLLALFERAGTPGLAVRYPESGEPTVTVDRDLSDAFLAWLDSQESITLGAADAASVRDL